MSRSTRCRSDDAEGDLDELSACVVFGGDSREEGHARCSH